MSFKSFLYKIIPDPTVSYKTQTLVTDSFYESWKKSRAQAAEYWKGIPRATQSLTERNSIKKHARYWDCWTGARYVREENPIVNMTLRQYLRSDWADEYEYKLPDIKDIKDIIVRSNAVTGDWELLNE